MWARITPQHMRARQQQISEKETPAAPTTRQAMPTSKMKKCRDNMTNKKERI